MFKKIRSMWRFISCRHELYLIGTTKNKEQTRLVIKCEKCDIRLTTDVKGMNKLSQIYGVNVKGV